MTGAKILAGNWKLNKTRSESECFFQELKDSPFSTFTRNARYVLCASDTLLDSCVRASLGLGIEIFAQNCSYESWGAYTGETSPKQLKELGVTGTLIGHSERRQYFGESNSSCVKRSICALNEGLQVIYCVGETLSERQNGQTQSVLEGQLEGVISEILPHWNSSSQLIFAYEPVWAIGTGLRAEASQIVETHSYIESILTRARSSSQPTILYGGSVKPDNFKEISALKGVSGALVGGASLKSSDFLAMAKSLD